MAAWSSAPRLPSTKRNSRPGIHLDSDQGYQALGSADEENARVQSHARSISADGKWVVGDISCKWPATGDLAEWQSGQKSRLSAPVPECSQPMASGWSAWIKCTPPLVAEDGCAATRLPPKDFYYPWAISDDVGEVCWPRRGGWPSLSLLDWATAGLSRLESCKRAKRVTYRRQRGRKSRWGRLGLEAGPSFGHRTRGPESEVGA